MEMSSNFASKWQTDCNLLQLCFEVAYCKCRCLGLGPEDMAILCYSGYKAQLGYKPYT